MSISDTRNTYVSVCLTLRYVEPVNGCVSQDTFMSKRVGAIDRARDEALMAMATDPNVYEAAVTWSIVDRDREALAFPDEEAAS